MSDYRRVFVKGGCYFFTAVTYERRRLLVRNSYIDRLRHGFRNVMTSHPFRLDAIVVLPDHMHCIWTLPEGDADFSTRWRLLKRHFSVASLLPTRHNGAKPVWQPRFWEHLIRNEDDFQRHLDYIHYNPVRHGYVNLPSQWAFSSFLRYAHRGWYDVHWGNESPSSLHGMERE